MLGIDSSEFLVIGAVALVVIGPRDLPRVMGQAGCWLGKAQRMSAHVRAGFDEMVRQAEVSAASPSPRATSPTSVLVPTPDTRARETHAVAQLVAVTATPAAAKDQADQPPANETSDLQSRQEQAIGAKGEQPENDHGSTPYLGRPADSPVVA